MFRELFILILLVHTRGFGKGKVIIFYEDINSYNHYFFTAASLAHISESAVCPGEELVSICTSIGFIQRWTIYVPSLSPLEKSFLSGESEGTLYVTSWGANLVFNFMLMSSNSQEFLSSLSFVMTEALDDTLIVCAGRSTDSFRIKLAGLWII